MHERLGWIRSNSPLISNSSPVQNLQIHLQFFYVYKYPCKIFNVLTNMLRKYNHKILPHNITVGPESKKNMQDILFKKITVGKQTPHFYYYVWKFICVLHVKELAQIFVLDVQGTPSGEAFIQMDTELSAETAALSKSKKLMFMNGRKCQVDVIQCSGQDMSFVLTTGLSSPPARHQSTIQQVPTFNTTPFILPPATCQLIPPNRRTVLANPANSQHIITPGNTLLHYLIHYYTS